MAMLSDGTKAPVTPLVTWAVHPSCGVGISSGGLLTATAPALAAVTATLARAAGVAAVTVSAPSGH